MRSGRISTGRRAGPPSGGCGRARTARRRRAPMQTITSSQASPWSMKSLARPMMKSFWRITVPRLPISSSTTPFQASRPASVTTNDGMPTFVMSSPCSRPIAEAGARAPARSPTTVGSSLPSGEQQQRGEHAADAGDEADRQVDLAQQQHEDDAHGDDRVRRRLDDQVDEVAGGQEAVVLRLEDDRDEDQADDDRQRAELAGLDVGPPAARVGADACRVRGASGASTGGSVTVLMRRPPRLPGPWTAGRR